MAGEDAQRTTPTAEAISASSVVQWRSGTGGVGGRRAHEHVDHHPQVVVDADRAGEHADDGQAEQARVDRGAGR